MKRSYVSGVFFLLLLTSACPAGSAPAEANGNQGTKLSGDAGGNRSAVSSPSAREPEKAAQSEPKTVREFFMAFSQDVFFLEGCEESKDPGCRKAKKKYLDTYLEIEDTKNGYLSAGADGAQAALTMTIFKRPSGKYIVAVNQFGEIGDDYNFFEYENGRWKDISKDVVPEYSTGNIYELPRFGTTIQVFKKIVIDSDGVVDMTEKGEKLYDLTWKDGRFTISR
ncbi:MAG: hypothetical protein IPM63_05650 [Acidobacteriota bacterium]|nr:MAG: hypothetical protein IPM63_05650 [Acidobacteriota bacterium]